MQPEEAADEAVQCWTCAGWGHTSRHCPSRWSGKSKGKGKGVFGYGNDDKQVLALVTNWPAPSPWKDNPYMHRFHKAVTQRARELGYEIQEFWMGEPGMTAKRLSNILRARNIPGLLIPPAFVAGKRLPFDVSAVAVASYGRVSWRPELNRVESDRHYNTALALKALRQLGYHRIGLACFGGTAWVHGHQLESAYAYHQSRGWIAADLPLFLRNDYGVGPEFFDWLRQHQVDCVLSTFPGVLNNLREAGIAVPKKIGFACIGVIPEIGDCAGIDIRSEVLDAALVDMVASQIALGERGVPAAPRALIIEGFWKLGATVKNSQRQAVKKPAIPPSAVRRKDNPSPVTDLSALLQSVPPPSAPLMPAAPADGTDT